MQNSITVYHTCEHNYVEVLKIWGDGVLQHLVAGSSTLNTCLFSRCVAMMNLIVLGRTMWAYVGVQKSGSARIPPLRLKRGSLPRNTPLLYGLTCQIWSLLMEQNEPKKWAPRVLPFKGTNGHRNWQGSIEYLCLSIVHSNHRVFRTVSEINGDFGQKIQKNTNTTCTCN